MTEPRSMRLTQAHRNNTANAVTLPTMSASRLSERLGIKSEGEE